MKFRKRVEQVIGVYILGIYHCVCICICIYPLYNTVHKAYNNRDVHCKCIFASSAYFITGKYKLRPYNPFAETLSWRNNSLIFMRESLKRSFGHLNPQNKISISAVSNNKNGFRDIQYTDTVIISNIKLQKRFSTVRIKISNKFL